MLSFLTITHLESSQLLSCVDCYGVLAPYVINMISGSPHPRLGYFCSHSVPFSTVKFMGEHLYSKYEVTPSMGMFWKIGSTGTPFLSPIHSGNLCLAGSPIEPKSSVTMQRNPLYPTENFCCWCFSWGKPQLLQLVIFNLCQQQCKFVFIHADSPGSGRWFVYSVYHPCPTLNSHPLLHLYSALPPLFLEFCLF